MIVPDVHCAHDSMIKIEELREHPRNPNTHPERQIELLGKIIRKQGWRAPITVSDRSGYIVRGHGRLQAARWLGLKTVPVDRQDYESDEAELADMIADNRIAELAIIDDEMLVDLIGELSQEEIDMELTGFDVEGMTDFVGSWEREKKRTEAAAHPPEKEIPASVSLLEKWKVKAGDVWTLGDHRLICGDCTDADVVARLMDGEKADMVFTDPPYGIDIVKSNQVGGGEPTKFGKVGGEKIVPSSTYKVIDGDDTTDTARAAYKIACDMRVKTIIMWGGNYFTDFLPPSPCWIVWDKENTGNFADVEMAWCNQKRGARLYKWLWNGLSRKGARRVELSSRVHPTQKPVGLFVKIFENFEGNNVLDFFIGSGSTMITCEEVGRRCFGGEKDPGYCAVILERWSEYTGKVPTLNS